MYIKYIYIRNAVTFRHILNHILAPFTPLEIVDPIHFSITITLLPPSV